MPQDSACSKCFYLGVRNKALIHTCANAMTKGG